MPISSNTPREKSNTREIRERELFHDARAAFDSAGFGDRDFRAEDGRQCWVAAILTPGAQSGAATIPGGYFDADTGEVIAPEGASAAMIVEGAWKEAASRPELSTDSGEYSWTEDIGRPKRGQTPDDLYNPFVYGGTIVFRPNPGEEGKAWFASAKMIPPDWVGHVRGAFDACLSKEELFSVKFTTQGEAEELRNLAAESNPIVAVMAVRRLLSAGKPDDGRPAFLMESADRFKTAVAAYLIATGEPSEIREKWMQSLFDKLRETKHIETMRAVALGAFSAALFHPGEQETRSRSKNLLKAVRRRLEELEFGVGKDTDFFLMFEKTGVH